MIVWEDSWEGYYSAEEVPDRLTDALENFWEEQQRYNDANLQKATAAEEALGRAQEVKEPGQQEDQAARFPESFPPFVESEVAKAFSRRVGGKAAREAQHVYKTVMLQNDSPNDLGCRFLSHIYFLLCGLECADRHWSGRQSRGV